MEKSIIFHLCKDNFDVTNTCNICGSKLIDPKLVQESRTRIAKEMKKAVREFERNQAKSIKHISK